MTLLSSNSPIARLSDRQVEIIYLVGKDGASWEDVQKILGISPSTVRTHVDRIQRKFNSKRPPREALTEIFWRYVAPNTDEAGSDLRQ